MPYNKNIHHRRSIRLKGYDYSQAGLYFITICVQNRKCLFGKIMDGVMVLNDAGTIAYQHWNKLPERFTNMELDVFQIMPNHMHGIIMLTDNVGATLAVSQNVFDETGAGASIAVDHNDMFDETGAGASIAVDQNVFDETGAGASIAVDQNVFDETGATLAVSQNDVFDEIGIGIAAGAGAGAGASPAPTKTIDNIVGAYKSLVANDCLEIFKQNHPGKMMGKLWQRNYYEHIIRDERSYQRISDYIKNNPQNWKEDKFYEQQISR